MAVAALQSVAAVNVCGAVVQSDVVWTDNLVTYVRQATLACAELPPFLIKHIAEVSSCCASLSHVWRTELCVTGLHD